MMLSTKPDLEEHEILITKTALECLAQELEEGRRSGEEQGWHSADDVFFRIRQSKKTAE